mmetsp:Transcript_11700/g.45590  ORF Transcript_11700/g.45590 Transcript_11700/m.45590 type:complete len:247 (+) Transcript_11700:804-1544(+)
MSSGSSRATTSCSMLGAAPAGGDALGAAASLARPAVPAAGGVEGAAAGCDATDCRADAGGAAGSEPPKGFPGGRRATGPEATRSGVTAAPAPAAGLVCPPNGFPGSDAPPEDWRGAWVPALGAAGSGAPNGFPGARGAAEVAVPPLEGAARPDADAGSSPFALEASGPAPAAALANGFPGASPALGAGCCGSGERPASGARGCAVRSAKGFPGAGLAAIASLLSVGPFGAACLGAREVRVRPASAG